MDAGLLEKQQWKEIEDACVNVSDRPEGKNVSDRPEGIKIQTGTERLGEYRENLRIRKRYDVVQKQVLGAGRGFCQTVALKFKIFVVELFHQLTNSKT